MGKHANDEKDIASIVFTLVFMALVSIAAWRLISYLPRLQPTIAPSIAVDSTPPTSPQPKPQTTAQPQQQKPKLRPDLLARLLQAQSDRDEPNLSRLLGDLSNEAIRGMGTYRRVNYEGWLLKARQSGIGVRSLEALADAQFISWFPSQQGKTLNPRTLGQVWYAIARNYTQSLQVQSVPSNSTQKGTLESGKGVLYRLKLQQNQVINVTLNASANVKLLLSSTVEPQATIAKKLDEDTWSWTVKRSGNYEMVVAPLTTSPTSYTIKWSTAQ